MPLSQNMAATSGGLEAVIKGAAVYLSVGQAVKDMDENEQDELLAKYKAETGECSEPAYTNRARRILKKLIDTDEVKRDYVVYVTPEEDINAFMTLGRVMGINKGTMDAMGDDQLAYVMSHELAHGEHKDVVNGIKKQIGLSTALTAVAGDSGMLGQVVANVANNFITNQVFTMNQEASADETGFKILTAAGFNPGGAAASMAVLHEKYGDRYSEGLTKVIAPNNHPKTSSRVQENLSRMRDYSNNHVDVKANKVYINDQEVYEPEAKYIYTGEMRAYLMAGKIAKLFHENDDLKDSNLYEENDIVYMNGVGIVTAKSSEDAQELISKIKTALLAKPSKKSHKAAKANSNEERTLGHKKYSK